MYLFKQPASADLGQYVENSHKKPILCVLCLIVVPHSPTDSITVYHKLLCKYIIKLHTDRHSSQRKHVPMQTLSEGCTNTETLAEVAWNWPQRASHAQKDVIVHDFHSVMFTQALKSITCASCTERVCHNK